ncbi:outer membrane beta-barrel protein [Paludibacterium paludis]|uniref:Outer membrane protein beta-barrel domain-containing protein n=1 Tax=Paludibacterium paludis TaxID=1225769 RepID=A0A918P069_9NEIS|nr:outer membrane beta-barrel protein [Paludibacterium paludis]GGY11213.1 hypothetical protein GCM10011289_12640 [Paludibacterium paludis]
MTKQYAILALLLAPLAARAADSGLYVFANTGYNPSGYSGHIHTVTPNMEEEKIDLKFRSGSSGSPGAIWELGGGYQLGPNSAVEVSYANLGRASARIDGSATEQGQTKPFANATGSASMDMTSLRVALLGINPVNDRFSVYGKVSVNSVSTKGTVRLDKFQAKGLRPFGSEVSESRTRNSLKLGLGLGGQLYLSKRFALRGEYEYLFGGNELRYNGTTVLSNRGVHLAKVGASFYF